MMGRRRAVAAEHRAQRLQAMDHLLCPHPYSGKIERFPPTNTDLAMYRLVTALLGPTGGE